MNRQVKVNLSDGGYVIDGGGQGNNYEFNPGDFCLVEPPNPRKLRHRGRIGQLTGQINQHGEIGIKFSDTNRVGYVCASDLIPYQNNF